MSTAASRALLSASKRQLMTRSLRACAQCQLARPVPVEQTRASSSNSRWKMRQAKDPFARQAKVQGLKSRAAYKLLEMDSKYKIFRRGQTVVDLGYAPGSWSQVAADRTKGQVLGIDIIPAQPPKGVSTIQGNFLSPQVQAMVKDWLIRNKKKRPPAPTPPEPSDGEDGGESATQAESTEMIDTEAAAVLEDKPNYIDMERAVSKEPALTPEHVAEVAKAKKRRMADVVLSDMSAPWDQTTGFGVNSLSNPYHRMMNTSGIAFRDHAGSMDLCNAALQFASDTLKSGGHFVCKFYQGSETNDFEKKLKTLFGRVWREKPESSRSDSKEAYFVALRRKAHVNLDVEDECT